MTENWTNDEVVQRLQTQHLDVLCERFQTIAGSSWLMWLMYQKQLCRKISYFDQHLVTFCL